MIRIASVFAACICAILPLSAEAGQRHGPSHWKTAPNGQGVIRVYHADTHAPPVYHGGNFHGGLKVETREAYATPDAAYSRSHECGSVCVVSAPPPHAAEGFTCHSARQDRHVVEHQSAYAYARHDRYDDGYGEPVYHGAAYERHTRGPDCACRHHGEYARYNAPYDGYGDDRRYDDRHHDDRYYDEPYHDGRYSRPSYDDRYRDDYHYGRDVFGRY